MKGTAGFKNTIQNYLENRAKTDELFAKTYAKENKNIDDCITYIINTAKDSKCNGFTDEEVFGMAVHFYDEGDIKVGKPVNCQVVVNHQVELTDEEKQTARQNALKRLEDESVAALKKKQEKKRKESENAPVQQLSLF